MIQWLADHWYLFGGSLLLVIVVVVLKWHDIHQRVGIWGYVGTMLGWIFIGLALMGGLLPLLPGFPMAILGLLLLGPNDPLVKRLWLLEHRIARHLAHSIYPRRQRLGLWLIEHEQRLATRLYKEGHVPPWREHGHEDPPEFPELEHEAAEGSSSRVEAGPEPRG